MLREEGLEVESQLGGLEITLMRTDERSMVIAV